MARSIDGISRARGDVAVPQVVVAAARGRSVQAVWVNEIGGRTFRIGDDGRAEEYVKVLPHAYTPWVVGEAARLTWASRYARVPELIDHGVDDDGAWLRTRALPGWSAVDPRWRDEPRTAVVAAGEGLRALHDTLPVLDCPFEWSTAQRAGRARAAGADPDRLGPEPPTDRVVVCHGDPCTPNTLIGADGRWAGHVDLDALGIADRWADIAVATMALGWNYGPGWDDLFHEAYGLPVDEARTAWYRALWNLDDDGIETAGPAGEQATPHCGRTG
ncbi:phosphotransferase [Curtobacterium sp. SP.BCo]|uniref:phosphotransferase n=1 Tax=Curtobacterium sp. SP.BCo TaxID=3435229 RepID=UPI003F73BBD6